LVTSARQRAEEIGDPSLAPPVPLEACDRNTIELALAKPWQRFRAFERYPTLEAKASALLYGLAKSQACIDGNKRIALIVVVAFLRRNGARLRLQPKELAEMILEVANTAREDHDRVIADVHRWIADRLEREEAP
jgi:death-on-curing family protein